MNISKISTSRLSFLFALAGSAMALTSTSANAQLVSGNDYVRIEGRMQSDSDRKEGGKGKVDTITQNRTLQITLSGKAKEGDTRKGTWTAYGRDYEGKGVTVIESGEFDIDFSKGAQKVETKKVSATYTPAHTPASKGGKGNDKGKGSKRVDAVGTKFAGFGVVVKDGDKVVGEYYDPAGLKAEAAK